MKPSIATLRVPSARLLAVGLATTFVLILSHQSRAATAVWANAGIDTNTGANWIGGTGPGGIPGALDMAAFDAATPAAQPVLSAPLSIQGVTFSTSGWSLTSTGNSLLMLTNTGAGANAAINAANASGVNAIGAGLVLGGAAGTTATFMQARGGTLTLAGNISSPNAITGLALAAGPGSGVATFTLAGQNTYAGVTTIGSNQKVNLNSASAISAGALVFGGSATIDNSSATPALTLAGNPILLSGGSLTYTGTNGNTLNFGDNLVTLSGNNRSMNLTSGTLVIGSLAADNPTRVFTKSGANGALVITGAAASSFQGGFILASGPLVIDHPAALGSGTFTADGGALQASITMTGARRIANNVLLGANTAIVGSNDIEFGGRLTGNAGGNRTLISNIAGGLLTLNAVDLSNDAGATPRTLTIAGAGDTTINGSILNGAGTTTANILAVTNTGTLNINGPQNYGALTTSAGTTRVNTALGGGASVVNANATTIFTASQTLATLSIGAGGTVTLAAAVPAFSGEADATSPVTAVPEPGSVLLIFMGAVGLFGRRRRD